MWKSVRAFRYYREYIFGFLFMMPWNILCLLVALVLGLPQMMARMVNEDVVADDTTTLLSNDISEGALRMDFYADEI